MGKNKISIIIILILCLNIMLTACNQMSFDNESTKEEIKVLILPKFEIGSMTDDSAGEAQYYYEEFLQDSKEYDIGTGNDVNTLYVKDGIAMFVTGMGKISATLSLSYLLGDDRFDFSNAYVLSTGCAGSNMEETVIGDVVIASGTVDYDLGHHVDYRDISNKNQKTTWYHDSSYDDIASFIANKELIEKAYDNTKDIILETTENTKKYMHRNHSDMPEFDRNPIVSKGTIVTADNYWKGEYDHENAKLICKTYNMPDPYKITEMEDHAISRTIDKYGIGNRYIAIRVSVNSDLYDDGANPDLLWVKQDINYGLESNEELDIFDTAMNNVEKVGSAIIKMIINE